MPNHLPVVSSCRCSWAKDAISTSVSTYVFDNEFVYMCEHLNLPACVCGSLCICVFTCLSESLGLCMLYARM